VKGERTATVQRLLPFEWIAFDDAPQASSRQQTPQPPLPYEAICSVEEDDTAYQLNVSLTLTFPLFFRSSRPTPPPSSLASCNSSDDLAPLLLNFGQRNSCIVCCARYPHSHDNNNTYSARRQWRLTTITIRTLTKTHPTHPSPAAAE
jgi:hypothetical protein